MGKRVQDFAESVSVSSSRLLKLYVVKTGKAFNFKLNLDSGVLSRGESCDLNRMMFPQRGIRNKTIYLFYGLKVLTGNIKSLSIPR